MKLINKTFIFESDKEIKEFIKILKGMKKNKVSYLRSLPNNFSLHNGKPSIPDYYDGYSKCKLLRERE